MVDIEKHLVPKIRARFGDRPIEEARGTEYKAIFRCIHPGFGDIYVSDEGEEITIFFGGFTHIHLSGDRGWPEEQYESDDDYAEQISEEAVDYLEKVFADEIEFYAVPWGGGCGPRRTKRRGFVRRALFRQHYVWSGPLDV